ncbi:MAG TPA: methyl-accepting chemotaxis protein, partial [Candidatus Competibacter sp.]|nr:methyl-accepting chemotaxis protein [Candidatus Competibacter sp.]
MFNKLKLRAQLNIGFALVITLLVIVSGTAYWGLQTAFKGFSEYRAIGRNSLQVAEFEERLLNARLAIQKYINQENSDYVKQYQDFSTGMHEQAKRLKSTVDSEHVKMVESIDQLINKYDSSFAQTVALTQQKNEIIRDMVELGLDMQRTVESIIENAAKENNAELLMSAGKVESQLLVSRYALLKYSQSRQRSDFDKTKEEITSKLEAVEDQMGEKAEKAGDSYRELLEDFEKIHESYLGMLPKLLESIEQADDITKNTLAQLGGAISKTTQELRTQYRTAQDQLGPRVQQSSAATIAVVTWLSIGAVLLGIALAWLLVRVIRRPIGGEPSEMAALTERIAQGDLTVHFENTGKETGIYAAMREMAGQLKGMVGQVTQATGQVHSAAAEIARGSGDLAQRTEEQ